MTTRLRKLEKIKDARNGKAIYGRGSMTANNIFGVSCAPAVTELIYSNFLSVCQSRIMLRKYFECSKFPGSLG